MIHKPLTLLTCCWIAFAASAGALVEPLPGANFTYAQSEKGWYKHGFRAEHDGTRDWRDFYGLQFDVTLADDRAAQVTAVIRIPEQPVRLDYVQQSTARMTVQGPGSHRVTLPWN